MSSLNKAQLIGHLGRDPETRYMPNGDAVTTFSIATSERWRDKQSGEQKEATEWHRICAFRQLAEICGKYLQKGSLVYIEGKIKTRKYTDKDGVEKYATEIIADTLQMLGGNGEKKERQHEAPQDDRSRQQKNADRNKSTQQPNFSDIDDDIPF